MDLCYAREDFVQRSIMPQSKNKQQWTVPNPCNNKINDME